MTIRKAAVLGFLGLATAIGCAGSETERAVDSDAGADCNPNDAVTCLCASGDPGIKVCATDGSKFGSCVCQDAGPGTCGDTRCSSAETCRTCPKDCGVCPKCASAPTCTGAEGVPSSTTPRLDLYVADKPYKEFPKSDGGVPSFSNQGCDDAQLRIRLEKVKTYKGGSELYCVINATDGKTSEVAITPKTKALKDGETYSFAPDVGLFWGQKDLKATSSNLTITYNCVRVKSDAFAAVLKAAGDASAQAGGYAGPYGWAFGIGSIGANIAAAAIQASSGDEQVLNAQQTIDASGLIDLTNNRSWEVRKSQDGGFGGFSWDWDLTIQTWGCADGSTAPN